ncbi:hypothetical protein [Mucilaginibacter lacusdianchii]|uniref:hypothetical protein n=1 Tax=Mucilaginibacter lacusdianchii TaxID=2684211 RepID=UPI00131C3DD2|nr:hypothetical protein [Mucilaginibacter sp. JXJ CY 39]
MMKVKTIFSCFLLVLLAFTACQQNPQNRAVKKNRIKPKTQPAVTSKEDQIVDLIINLEEVKRKGDQVEKLSKGKRHLSTYVETEPTAQDPNYWVKVAEDNGGSLVTYYTFAVDGKTKQIQYYDVVQDTVLSLKQWRQTTPLAER